MLRSLALLTLLLVAVPTRCQSAPAYDATPRIGLLVPVGPPDYGLLLDALEKPTVVHDGPFTFRAATVGGVAVVIAIQPTDGDVARALEAQEMLRDFNVRALLYAGTSGGHLPKGEMGVGDMVLGAKNVNTANYYLSPKGEIQAGTFDAMQPTIRHYGALYMDPRLLAMLACSANAVAAATTLPGWMAPVAADRHPQVFFYGIQGTSSIWSDNAAYSQKTQAVFHEMDEDGDWDSALVAALWHVPFVEVSIISNSIFAHPDRDHGTPAAPAGEPNSHVYAQRLSNRVALELVRRYGAEMLRGTYTTMTTSPYADRAFLRPREAGDLLQGCAAGR